MPASWVYRLTMCHSWAQGSLRHVIVEAQGQEGPYPGLSRLQDWSPPSQPPCPPQGLPGNLDALLASLFHQHHLAGIASPRPMWLSPSAPLGSLLMGDTPPTLLGRGHGNSRDKAALPGPSTSFIQVPGGGAGTPKQAMSLVGSWLCHRQAGALGHRLTPLGARDDT